MAGEWRIERFERIATLSRNTVHPSEATGLPYIGLEHIAGGALALMGIGVAEDVASTKSRFLRGDVLFGKLRPYFRKVVRAPFDGICSTDIWVVRPRSGVDGGFLFYLMASDLFVEPVVRASEGTKMPRAKWEYAASLKLPLPSLPEQRAIAHILGTLDDKIELNRRMNETLEAMARAIFKSWFVDFDPVRAKAAGRDPGLPKNIADLFSDRLVESKLGEIPAGWEVGELGDVAEHLRRGVQSDKIKPETPYIALEHMPKRSIALSEWGIADGLKSNKFEFRQGEILFGKLRPYFHKVGVAPVDGVCSTDIVVVAPQSELWFGFVLGHVSSDEFVDYTNAGSTGTKMPRTNWAEMARYEVALPPEPVAGAFTKHVRSLVKRVNAGIYESRTLAALRDTLLPKLISGELRVPINEAQIPSSACD
ncbi:MAG: restriction endonuclease subunit S [Thermoleophilia bacterium]